jgi:hypothetical protein
MSEEARQRERNFYSKLEHKEKINESRIKIFREKS